MSSRGMRQQFLSGSGQPNDHTPRSTRAAPLDRSRWLGYWMQETGVPGGYRAARCLFWLWRLWARQAWDLCLYLECPRPDLMGQIRVAAPFKAPWYIDLPNINLNNEDPPQGGSGSASTWMHPAGTASA
jgi:hypothetical protein